MACNTSAASSAHATGLLTCGHSAASGVATPAVAVTAARLPTIPYTVDAKKISIAHLTDIPRRWTGHPADADCANRTTGANRIDQTAASCPPGHRLIERIPCGWRTRRPGRGPAH